MKKSIVLCLLFQIISGSFLRSQIKEIHDDFILLEEGKEINSNYQEVHYKAKSEINIKPNFEVKNSGSLKKISFKIDEDLGVNSIVEGNVAGYVKMLENWNKPLDLSLPVASINSKHNVTLTGGFSYDIPIKLPKHQDGNLIPQLGVSYNSQNGYTNFGTGWSINTISVISRAAKNIDVDGNVSPVTCESDELTLDGERLVHYDDIDLNTRQYYFESRKFARVIYLKDREVFEITYRDGKKHFYGHGNNSKVLCESGNVYQWRLSRIEDVWDNYINYNYVYTSSDEQILESVVYGNRAEELGKIIFTYQHRTDKRKVKIAGEVFLFESLVKKIDIFSKNEVYRRYVFDYINGEELTFPSTTLLIGITEILPNGVPLNSIRFKYGDDTATDSQISPLAIDQSDFINVKNRAYYPGDFDGDGLTDLLYLDVEFENDKREKARYIGWGIFFKEKSGFVKKELAFDPILLGGKGVWRSYDEESYFKISGFNFLFGDLTGDGADDIVYGSKGVDGSGSYCSYAWHYGLMVSGARYMYKHANSATFFSAQAGSVDLVDLNGDGMLELFGFSASRRFEDGLNVSEKQWDLVWVSQSWRFDGMNIRKVITGAFNPVNFQVYATDSDGDGTDEILFTYENMAVSSPNPIPLFANFSGFIDFNFIYNSESNSFYLEGNSIKLNFESAYPLFQGFITVPNRYINQASDFNGDGLEDVIMIDDNEDIVYYLNRGEYAKTPFGELTYQTIPLNGDISAKLKDEESFQSIIYDLDQDGYSDFLFFEKESNNFIVYYNKAQFGNFDSYTRRDYELSGKTDWKTIGVGDYNGNGEMELLKFYSIENYGEIFDLNELKGRTFNSQKHLTLTGVKDGFDNVVEVDYGVCTKVSDHFISTGHDVIGREYRKAKNGLYYVINKLESRAKTGANGEYVTHEKKRYSFSSLIVNSYKKESLGFERFKVYDDMTKTVKSVYSDLMFGKLMPVSETLEEQDKDWEEAAIKRILRIYDRFVYPEYGNAELIFLSNEKVREYIEGVTLHSVETNNTYEQETGNLLKVVELRDGQRSITTTNSSFVAVSDGLTPSKPQLVCTESFLSGDVFRVCEKYEYDRDVISESISFFDDILNRPNDKSLISKYGYNDFGLLETLSESNLDNSDVRISSEVYDPDNQAIIRTNAMGFQTISQGIDFYGNPRQVTDLNGLVTQFEYDDLGRLKKTIDPSGNIFNVVYEWVKNPTSDVLHKKSIHQDGIDSRVIVYYDAVGRKIHTETTRFDGASSWQTTKYLANGLLWFETLPYENGAQSLDIAERTTFIYDERNRKIEVQHPYGEVTEFIYSSGGDGTLKVTETKSWESGSHFYYKNSSNQLVKKDDSFGNKIEYAFHPNGEIRLIKTDEMVMENQFDPTYGWKIKAEKPNTGVSEYDYNSFGELVYEKDFKGNILQIIDRDPLGRVNKQSTTNGETNEEITFSYVFDEGNMAVGKLSSEESSRGHRINYEYDNYSRPYLKIETRTATGIPNIYQYDYDEFSRLYSTTYPTGIIESYNYNTHGYLDKMFLNNEVDPIWQAMEYDALGRNTLEKVLGRERGRTYKNGFLKSHGTSGVYEREYEFEKGSGNLIWRKDVLRNLLEEFTYDKHDRLETSKVGEVLTSSVNYDETNMSYRKGVGSFKYSNEEKPNQLSGIEDVELESIPEQTLKYTSFNKVETILQKSANGDKIELQIEYGVHGKRLKSTLTETILGIPINTVREYFEGYFTVSTSQLDKKIYHPIYANGSLVALAVKDNPIGLWKTYSIYTDYLGSIELIRDENGVNVEEASFTPWGKRRNPDTWREYEVSNQPNPLMIGLGYTGHEHFEKLDLINMNGRFYDPSLAIMLSPDMHVQNPNNHLNFNKYSYVMNNPMRYTDPSGNSYKDPPAHGNASGGYINIYSNGTYGWSIWSSSTIEGVGGYYQSTYSASGGVNEQGPYFSSHSEKTFVPYSTDNLFITSSDPELSNSPYAERTNSTSKSFLEYVMDINSGAKAGVEAGIMSTVDFVVGLTTSEGWIELAESVGNMAVLICDYCPGSVMMREQLFSSIVNYVEQIPNMSAYEIAYDAGYLTEKIFESVFINNAATLISVKGVQAGLNAAKTSTNAFKHSFKYGKRVRTRALQDPVSHNFPYSFDDAILKTQPILKNNGYKIFQKAGTMNGKNGVFEIGLTKNGVIDHRFFRPY